MCWPVLENGRDQLPSVNQGHYQRPFSWIGLYLRTTRIFISILKYFFSQKIDINSYTINFNGFYSRIFHSCSGKPPYILCYIPLARCQEECLYELMRACGALAITHKLESILGMDLFGLHPVTSAIAINAAGNIKICMNTEDHFSIQQRITWSCMHIILRMPAVMW